MSLNRRLGIATLVAAFWLATAWPGSVWAEPDAAADAKNGSAAVVTRQDVQQDALPAGFGIFDRADTGLYDGIDPPGLSPRLNDGGPELATALSRQSPPERNSLSAVRNSNGQGARQSLAPDSAFSGLPLVIIVGTIGLVMVARRHFSITSEAGPSEAGSSGAGTRAETGQ